MERIRQERLAALAVSSSSSLASFATLEPGSAYKELVRAVVQLVRGTKRAVRERWRRWRCRRASSSASKLCKGHGAGVLMESEPSAPFVDGSGRLLYVHIGCTRCAPTLARVSATAAASASAFGNCAGQSPLGAHSAGAASTVTATAGGWLRSPSHAGSCASSHCSICCPQCQADARRFSAFRQLPVLIGPPSPSHAGSQHSQHSHSDYENTFVAIRNAPLYENANRSAKLYENQQCGSDTKKCRTHSYENMRVTRADSYENIAVGGSLPMQPIPSNAQSEPEPAHEPLTTSTNDPQPPIWRRLSSRFGQLFGKRSRAGTGPSEGASGAGAGASAGEGAPAIPPHLRPPEIQIQVTGSDTNTALASLVGDHSPSPSGGGDPNEIYEPFLVESSGSNGGPNRGPNGALNEAQEKPIEVGEEGGQQKLVSRPNGFCGSSGGRGSAGKREDALREEAGKMALGLTMTPPRASPENSEVSPWNSPPRHQHNHNLNLNLNLNNTHSQQSLSASPDIHKSATKAKTHRFLVTPATPTPTPATSPVTPLPLAAFGPGTSASNTSAHSSNAYTCEALQVPASTQAHSQTPSQSLRFDPNRSWRPSALELWEGSTSATACSSLTVPSGAHRYTFSSVSGSISQAIAMTNAGAGVNVNVRKPFAQAKAQVTNTSPNTSTGATVPPGTGVGAGAAAVDAVHMCAFGAHHSAHELLAFEHLLHEHPHDLRAHRCRGVKRHSSKLGTRALHPSYFKLI